jgi:hypothetical protein
VDSGTQQDAGACSPGQHCTADGQCVANIQTPPISVTEQGTVRTIVPPTSPPSSSGGPTVGAIPAKFEVSDRGSATYTVPLEVPPGGPITPSLELAYASSSGNGALGTGWSLGGLSQISLCQRTFAQDGYTVPIVGDGTDALCLDGQRLVSVPDQTNGIQYRTEVDTFTQVRPHFSSQNGSSPDYFVAYTKDGRILTYGLTGVSTLANGKPSAWNLTRVEDRSGNFMTIDYMNFHPSDKYGLISTAEILPTAITYGGRYGTTVGDRVIRLIYDLDRPDHVIGYRTPGSFSMRRSRLKRIDITASGVRVRSYQLGYDEARGTSRLKSLTECSSSDSLCKLPTTFDYYQEFGFEQGKTITIDCAWDGYHCDGADANILGGLSPYGYALQNGPKAHLGTATLLTTIDTGLSSLFEAIGFGVPSCRSAARPEYLRQRLSSRLQVRQQTSSTPNSYRSIYRSMATTRPCTRGQASMCLVRCPRGIRCSKHRSRPIPLKAW